MIVVFISDRVVKRVNFWEIIIGMCGFDAHLCFGFFVVISLDFDWELVLSNVMQGNAM